MVPAMVVPFSVLIFSIGLLVGAGAQPSAGRCLGRGLGLGLGLGASAAGSVVAADVGLARFGHGLLGRRRRSVVGLLVGRIGGRGLHRCAGGSAPAAGAGSSARRSLEQGREPVGQVAGQRLQQPGQLLQRGGQAAGEPGQQHLARRQVGQPREVAGC